MNAVEGLYKVTKKGNDFELFSLSWNANIEESTNSICKIKDDDKFKPLYPVKCIFTCDAIIS